MITPAELRQAIIDKNSTLTMLYRPLRHDDIVVFIRKGHVPKGLKTYSVSGSTSLAVRRIDAEIWLSRLQNPQSATMGVAAKPNQRTTAMPAPTELSDRAMAAMNFLFDNGSSTAKQVAEAIQPGSDSRGAAQTLRRLTSNPAYVEKTDDGYKLTRSGRARITKMRSGSDAPDSPAESPAED